MILYLWELSYYIWCTSLSVIVRVDSKGRITLPKEIRKRCNIVPGSRVVVEVKGKGEVLVKVIESDPSKELAKILKDFTFTREDRVKAEKLLLKEVM
ncbi:MAG: hypothetical protein DRO23_05855 [Thermoprotei archaeon]|nr:MAG: hypothetical protein DRO23_05855 [Thermoprotei archaeon]